MAPFRRSAELERPTQYRARAALGAPPNDADGPAGRGSRDGLHKIFGQIGSTVEEMLQPVLGGGRRPSERDDDAAAGVGMRLRDFSEQKIGADGDDDRLELLQLAQELLILHSFTRAESDIFLTFS